MGDSPVIFPAAMECRLDLFVPSFCTPVFGPQALGQEHFDPLISLISCVPCSKGIVLCTKSSAFQISFRCASSMAHWLHGRPAGFCSDSILNTSQKGQKWRRRERGARSWWKPLQKLHELVVLGHELCRGRIYVLSPVIWSYSVKDRVSVSAIHTNNQSHRGSGDRKLRVPIALNVIYVHVRSM